MSEQDTVEKTIIPEEAKELPCIYGSEIHKVCSVRQEAQKNMSSDLSKWIKPNMKDEHLRELTGMLDRTMNAFTAMNLDGFCACCPWLEIYLAHHSK
jgi:hypothetical protein